MVDTARLTRVDEFEWRIEPRGAMLAPGVIYASEALILEMDEKVAEQVCNVAALPGIVQASYAMPDAHWGYGFPIGGVAAFDAEKNGVISAGGVGFDISCGVRTLRTGLVREDILEVKQKLADLLYNRIPAGVGSTGPLRLDHGQMEGMLSGGAQWAVEQGYGRGEDLEYAEEGGRMRDARPEDVSDLAKKRQRDEMGTLGSGNHYLELQQVTETMEQEAAAAFGIRPGDILISIHCGSRGLGHQIATDFQKRMVISAREHGLHLTDRELACAPINSALGQSYLGAMRAGINCALANRQILMELTRRAFAQILPHADLSLLYDVSHNTCKVEEHEVDGINRRLFVHRKGATRAFGPGNPDVPGAYRHVGQPVLIGGTMGTSSYILVGTEESEKRAFSSACHGAGRNMSRRKATKQWRGREILKELDTRGILIRGPSMRGIAEEAPGAYKDVSAVVDASHEAGLARTVAKLEPLLCIKG